MKSDKDLYKHLRDLPKERLWSDEVSRFNAAVPEKRLSGVGVIRAVGTIFSRFGTEEEKNLVREWLIDLLKDPQEKIRRYALAALPKIGPGIHGEAAMLALLKNSEMPRERKYLGRALEKVGGEATLALAEKENTLPLITVQKVMAGLARRQGQSGVLLDAMLPADQNSRVSLRCRRGLEEFVRDEAKELLAPSQWLIGKTMPGCVSLKPLSDFSLSSLYKLRCFATVSFPLGSVPIGKEGINQGLVERLAGLISSRKALNLMLPATGGTPRYRLDLVGLGHQRGAIRQIIDLAYQLEPQILNDARQALWSVDVIPSPGGHGDSSVELRPRLYPDPRLAYRQDDISAASHPPLAACMARLAGMFQNERIWDPFCGSGLELIERSLRGGVSFVCGTDLDPRALRAARSNFEAAGLDISDLLFEECDFRKVPISPASLSLIITNPPLGRRIRIKDMKGLFADLYSAAAKFLTPAGRLVLVNPLRTEPQDPSLKLEYRKPVDLGGFQCRLEMYRKL